MRHAVPAVLAIAAALLLVAPTVQGSFEISDVDVYDERTREPLARVQVNAIALFIVEVESTDSHDGALTAIFNIRSDDGGYTRQDRVTRTVSLDAGDTVELDLSWQPTRVGDHTLEVHLEEQPGTVFTLRFVVAESQVPRASFVERVIEHGWFYGTFLVLLIAFVAVARLRKPGT